MSDSLTTANAPTAEPAQQTEQKLSLRHWLPTPAVIFMIIVTQIPLLFTLRYSMERWNLNRPDRRAFIGLNKFPDVLTDNDFWIIIGNTLYLTLAVVIITLILGMMLALLLNREFFGRGIVRTLLITPFLIMPTVSAVIWKNVLFWPTNGLFAAILGIFGLPPIDFLANYAMPSVIAIVVWQWTPFMMLILLAGLQSLDGEQLEAAQIDGAGLWDMFLHIVVPHLRRYIELAVLMETLFILSVFGVIFITTSGGPGTQTTNLSYAIFEEAFIAFDIGEASVMGIYAIILANIVVALFVQVLRRGQEEGISA